jgi:hypothetical protein
VVCGGCTVVEAKLWRQIEEERFRASEQELLMAVAVEEQAAETKCAAALAREVDAKAATEAAQAEAILRLACEYGHAPVVELLLADPRVDPSKGRPSALELASKGGHTEVVRMLLTNRSVAVTASVLTAADAGNHEDVFRLLMNAQPAVIFDLFAGGTPCMAAGLLVNELRGLEKLSARALLLCVRCRTGGAYQLSNVLCYVMKEFACFDVGDTLEDDNDEQ